MKLSLIICTLLLTGCATCEPIYRVVTPPQPPEIVKPVCEPIDLALPVDAKVRLLAECEAKRDAYTRELEQALSAYKTP